MPRKTVKEITEVEAFALADEVAREIVANGYLALAHMEQEKY